MTSWLLGQTIVETLIDAGVDHVVLCPGSRNSPLSIALARANQLTLHTRPDERAAGFLALGLAKASGIAAVVVTSGSAVGNLMPSVMEAYSAGLALLVITADRPATLVGTRANQTTNQTGIFASHTVNAIELISSDANQHAWVAQIRRAIVAAKAERSGRPGPVHINARFAEPLTPDGSRLAELKPFRAEQTWAATPRQLPYLAGTVLVAGDLPPSQGRELAAFAEQSNLPLLAEPSSNARQSANAIAGYHRLLEGQLASEIKRVIIYGHPTLSRQITRLLSRADIELIAVGDANWSDPGAQVNQVVDALTMPADRSDWLTRWKNENCRVLAENPLETSRPNCTAEYQLALKTELTRQIIFASQTIVFGASNAIRYADRVAEWPTELTCYANRGLAGIDGTIATASGIALANGEPVTALMGDLTFLYDAGSLMIPVGQSEPKLRVVVFDDNGGCIFNSLEVADQAYNDVFSRAFTMPHGHDLEKIASGYQVKTLTVKTVQELLAALNQPIEGLSVIIVALDQIMLACE